MDREIITITDEGTIIVPDNPSWVRMTIMEIAELLGVYYQTAKRHIQTIETRVLPRERRGERTKIIDCASDTS